jgi:hypothetical protein
MSEAPSPITRIFKHFRTIPGAAGSLRGIDKLKRIANQWNRLAESGLCHVTPITVHHGASFEQSTQHRHCALKGMSGALFQ